jgi:hypothetical protein
MLTSAPYENEFVFRQRKRRAFFNLRKARACDLLKSSKNARQNRLKKYPQVPQRYPRYLMGTRLSRQFFYLHYLLLY